MKYLVKHWLNVDMIAEEVIDETDINFKTNNLGKYETSRNKLKNSYNFLFSLIHLAQKFYPRFLKS